MIATLTRIFGRPSVAAWQTDTSIADVDLIVIPGGISHGDYLRCGAMTALSPVMRAVREKADRGVMLIGVCNRLQIRQGAGMLPDAALAQSTFAKIHARPQSLMIYPPSPIRVMPVPQIRPIVPLWRYRVFIRRRWDRTAYGSADLEFSILRRLT